MSAPRSAEAPLTQATATLRLTKVAPGEARAIVRDWMGAHPRVGDVQLAVSEVITNALRHTVADEVEVLMTHTVDGRHRISVRYAGDPFSAVPRRDPTAASGRGLLIVQSVTDRWGMMADGRVDVWFEV